MTALTPQLATHDRPLDLAALNDALRSVCPTPALDARLGRTIEDFRRAHQAAHTGRWTRARWVWAPGPAIAAGAAALAMAGLVLWGVHARYQNAAPADLAAGPGRSMPLLAQPSPQLAQSDPVMEQSRGGLVADAADTFAVAPGGMYSLWPTEAAVFRVRTRLDATAPDLGRSAAPAGERQFWVDVRVANDGSMRIVRIVPADSGEPEPGPSN